jgi:hypothetical protein
LYVATDSGATRIILRELGTYHGVDECLRNEIHDSQNSEHSSCLLSDVVPIDVFGPRILKFVDQSRKHNILVMVANG